MVAVDWSAPGVPLSWPEPGLEVDWNAPGVPLSWPDPVPRNELLGPRAPPVDPDYTDGERVGQPRGGLWLGYYRGGRGRAYDDRIAPPPSLPPQPPSPLPPWAPPVIELPMPYLQPMYWHFPEWDGVVPEVWLVPLWERQFGRVRLRDLQDPFAILMVWLAPPDPERFPFPWRRLWARS